MALLAVFGGHASRRAASARQFTASNTEYLSHIDHADLSTGDIAWAAWGWGYLDSTSESTPELMSKWGTAGQREWACWYAQAIDKFQFSIYDGTDAVGTVQSDAGINVGQWYFLVIEHDPVANTVTLQIDNGTVKSSGTSGVSVDGTDAFHIGAEDSGSVNAWDGRITAVGFMKRAVTTAERSALYNNGIGLRYANIPASLKDDATLRYWDLQEASGVATEASGSGRDLTDNNTVTQATGPGA